MPEIAFIFPGQGAQVVGMAKDVAEKYSAARARFDAAAETLGFDLARLCFDGPDETLKRTDISQPAIFVTSLALLDAVKERRPDLFSRARATAGLSLGEYTALVFAGVLSFDDGLRLVANRGKWMQEACDAAPGAMASIIGLSEEKVRDACAAVVAQGAGVVCVANVNEPAQIAISGETAAVKKACDLAQKAGARRAIELKVAGAFHSPLMAPAEMRLATMIEGLRFADPRVPVYCNASGEAVNRGDDLKRQLVRQLTSPVLFLRSVRAMSAAGINEYWEVGPGTVLTGLVRRIDDRAARWSVGSVADIEKAAAEQRVVARHA